MLICELSALKLEGEQPDFTLNVDPQDEQEELSVPQQILVQLQELVRDKAALKIKLNNLVALV